MTKNNGGPAFPHSFETLEGHPHWRESQGMTLRDWFAGQALAGISSLGGDGFSLPPQDEAAWAYARADAMLAARETSHE